MSKQVLSNGIWYDVSYIQQDGDTHKFLVVHQYKGRPTSCYVDSSVLRDKPDMEVKSEVDWEKPLQIKCEEWYDVIFHKIYNIEVLKDGFCDTRISLIFEKDGEPIYVQDILRDLTIRNKAPSLTFEKWIIYCKNGIVRTCGAEREAQRQLLLNREYKIKHIKVEWEL